MDITTIGLLLAVISVLSFGSLLLLGISFSFEQGTRKWMWGSLAQGVGVFLLLTQGTSVPALWSIYVANLFIFLSYILFLEGLIQYHQLPSKWKIHILFMSVMAILFFLFYDDAVYFVYRVQLNALGLTLYSSWIIFYLFQNKQFAPIATKLLMIAFGLLILISLTRLFGGFNYQGGMSLLVSNRFNNYIFLGAIIIIFLYSTGLILLVSEQKNYLIQLSKIDQDYTNQVLNKSIDDHKHFLFAIAHEFINPMSSIQSSKQILQNLSAQDPIIKGELERIDRSIARMSQTVKDAADLNQPLNYLRQQFQQRVAIAEVIEDVCSRYGVPVFNHTSHEVLILGEETLLKLIFSNLISNAIKYSHELSSVRVELTETPSTIHIHFYNSGKFLSKEEENRVFEKEYKGDGSSGFGFGLYFVKTMVERMSGSISLEAKELIKFSISFPYYQNKS